MKKIMFPTAAAVVMLAAGCGHNIVNYTNGDNTAFGVTVSESGYPIFGFKRMSGENLTAAVKDNTLVSVSLENGAAASGGKEAATAAAGQTARVSGLLMYTGDQTTGYDVEMIEAIAGYDVEAAKAAAAKRNATWVEGKLDENGRLVVTEVKLGDTAAKAGPEAATPENTSATPEK